eukprot:5337087-Amphidinium_carterae.1
MKSGHHGSRIRSPAVTCQLKTRGCRPSFRKSETANFKNEHFLNHTIPLSPCVPLHYGGHVGAASLMIEALVFETPWIVAMWSDPPLQGVSTRTHSLAWASGTLDLEVFENLTSRNFKAQGH